MKAMRIPLRVAASGVSMRYGLALACSLLGLILRGLLAPIFGVHVPYYTVWGAIAFAAWFCGIGPAILATFVGMVGIWIWFPMMPGSYAQENGVAGLVSFLLLSGVIIAFGERSRRLAVRRDLAERQANIAKTLFEGFMDNSPGAAYMKDVSGRYVYANRTFRERFRLPHPEGKKDSEIFSGELAAAYRTNDTEVLKDGKPREFIEYTHDPDGQHAWLSIKFTVTDPDGNILLCGKSFDITDRVRAEEALRDAHRELEERVQIRTAQLIAANANLRELSARLLQVRDEEHRRIARELHDSVGQLLAAVSMNITTLQREVELPENLAKAVTESSELLEQAVRETRTISHLLHPPLLDEVGLSSALRWYVDGFAERSRIKIDLHISTGSRRFPPDVEVAIFRLVQECLTNIHRHSGSATAGISLHPEDGWVCIEVRDAGKGIPEEKRAALASDGQVGVGIRGMRERFHQLGGKLEIESGPSGTVVRASIPISAAALIGIDKKGESQSPYTAA